MTQAEDWPRRLTAGVAEQVKRLRGGRMSAQQLADATAELGHPVARSVIANLESGRRDTVSVAEIVVLARALGVPPLLLVFPVGSNATVELLPGEIVDTWSGAKWFTGEQPFPNSGEDIEELPTSYFREQDRLIAEWYRARDRVMAARAEVGRRADRPDIENLRQQELHWLEETLLAVEAQLGLYRAIMRRQGVDPGELPSELSHVQQRGSRDGER
jgi:transcriptional regulator with XRE-family HTH domain